MSDQKASIAYAPGRFRLATIPEGELTVMRADGLGDAILGLLACPGSGTYACAASAIPFVMLFDGYDRLADERGIRGGDRLNDGAAPYAAECRDRGRNPRYLRYAANAGRRGRLRMPRLRDRDAIAAKGKPYAGAIVLAPFSCDPRRQWSLPHWQTLEAELIAAGYRVVILTQSAASGFRSEQLIAPAPEAMAGALLRAACVVGNDSGPAHLSGVLGTPTVVICGPTRGVSIYGAYPRVRCLQGKLHCDSCYYLAPYTDRCKDNCADLQTINPADVLAAVDAHCLPVYAAGRSALSSNKLAVLRREVLRTNRLAGDVAEFGVWQGGSAALLRRYAAEGATLRLFDTFAGMPTDDVESGGHRRGDFADCDAASIAALIPDAILHPGFFPDSAPPDALYRFAHVDCDIRQSVEAALSYFVPRMTPGGVMVFDDYGWWKCPGVQAALSARYGDVEKGAEYQAIVRIP
jgi:hypothetical protein